MAKQLITIGTPGAGGGDPAHAAFKKINDNTNDAYSFLGAGESGVLTAEGAREALNTYSKGEVYSKDEADSLFTIDDALKYMPIAWPKSTAPTGYLVMMGQAISQAIYPKLYALYGSTLPDLRAYSIRGLDHGRGIDTGRTVLSEQGDENKNHNHGVVRGTGGLSDVVFTIESPGANALSSRQFKISGTVYPANDPIGRNSDLAMSSSGGVETTVKNIAFLYIVKAG